MTRRYNKKSSGHSFTEYALLIGVISLAFFAMNTYIKRGLQGQVKDMTDYFISADQVGSINPDNSTVNNTSNTVSQSALTRNQDGNSVWSSLSEDARIRNESKVCTGDDCPEDEDALRQ